MRRNIVLMSILLLLSTPLVTVIGAPSPPEDIPEEPGNMMRSTQDFYDWGPVYEVSSETPSEMELLVTDDQDAVILWGPGPVDFVRISKHGTILDHGTLDEVEGEWDVAMTGDGSRILAVWATEEGKLQMKSFNINGQGEGQTKMIALDASGISSPSVAVGPDGKIFITYIANNHGSPVPAFFAIEMDGTTLLSKRNLDPDGDAPLEVDLKMGDGGVPVVLLSTEIATYTMVLDKNGAMEWREPLFNRGEASHVGISLAKDVVASTWLEDRDVHWSMVTLSGSMVSTGEVDLTISTTGLSASLLPSGRIHAIVNDGTTLEHLSILPGEGIENRQKVISLVSPTSPFIMTPDVHEPLHLVYMKEGIFYSHASTYGFDVVETSLEGIEALHPGEKARGEIVLRNTGGLVDAAGFDATLYPSNLGWNVDLSVDEIYLPKDGEGRATVTLFSPQDGQDGDTVNLALHLWSLSAPSRGMDITLQVTLLVDHSIVIGADDDTLIVPPGASEVQTVTVENRGEVSEDLRMSVSVRSMTDQGGQDDWYAVVSNNKDLVLEPGEQDTVNVTVTAPENVREGDVGVFDLMAVPKEAPEHSVKRTLYAMALSDIDLSMEIITKDDRTVKPGDTIKYDVVVTNDGVSDTTISVTLEVVSGVGDWNVYLARESIELAGSTSKRVPLTLEAPEDAYEGSRFVVRVRAMSTSSLRQEVAKVTTTVSKVTDIRTVATDVYEATDPGDEANYEFEIINQGNGRENILLYSETPFGWSPVTYEVDGRETNSINLEIGETVKVNAKVHVPVRTDSGEYDVKIRVINGEMKEIDLVTRVNMISDIWLSASQTVRETVDGKAIFNIRVKNYGNGPDEIQFITEGLPLEWRMDLPDTSGGFLQLAKDNERFLTMEVVVPDSVHEEEVEFKLKALPLRGEASIINLLIKVVPSDLEIAGIEFSTDAFNEGDVETITVFIRNNGLGPAGRVTVMAEDNGAVLGFREIMIIRSGSTSTATFTWVVSEGDHELTFTVDPENKIFEKREDNNREKVQVSSTSNDPSVVQVSPSLMAGATITLSLTALAVGTAATEWGRFKLIWVFWIPLYTKLKRTGVLDHFLRGQVYGYIKANPGEHYSAIKKALDMKNGTLVYHLQTLEREEYVKSVSDGRYKRFYPAGMKIPDSPTRKLNKIQEIILKLIGDNPGINQKEIAEEVGLSSATINYHINVMLKLGVIEKEKVGRTTHMYVIEEVEEEMEKEKVGSGAGDD